MRIVSLIDGSAVIKHIMRHICLLEQCLCVIAPARALPEIVGKAIVPWLDCPFADYDSESVIACPSG